MVCAPAGLAKDRIEQDPADRLFAKPSEHAFGLGVPVHDAAAEIEGNEGIVGGPENRLGPFLALEERLLRRPTIADVPAVPEDGRGPDLLVILEAHQAEGPAVPAVLGA